MFFGCGHFTTASTLDGSILIPSLLMTWPRNDISFWLNSHFDFLAYNLCCLSVCKTHSKCFRCSSCDLLYTNMSSRNMITNSSKYLLNTLCIRFINVAGALVKPNGMTSGHTEY